MDDRDSSEKFFYNWFLRNQNEYEVMIKCGAPDVFVKAFTDGKKWSIDCLIVHLDTMLTHATTMQTLGQAIVCKIVTYNDGILSLI